MKLRGISRDGPKVIRHLGYDLNIRSERFTDYVCEITDQVSRLDRALMIIEPPGEGINLAHQVGPTTATAINGIEDFAAALIVNRAEFEHLDRHHDRRKHAIQTVSNAPSEGVHA